MKKIVHALENILVKLLTRTLSFYLAKTSLILSGVSSQFGLQCLNLLLDIFGLKFRFDTDIDYYVFYVCILLTLFFFSVNFFENRSLNEKEFIAIRHSTINNFPNQAIKEILTFSQKLLHYREINLDIKNIKNNINGAIKETEEVPIKLDAFKEINGKSYFSYYGLAHIPFAFYLGYLLRGFKSDIKVFELNNKSNKWNNLQCKKTINVIKSDIESMTDNNKDGSIILKIQTSYNVKDNLIESIPIDNLIQSFTISTENLGQNNINTYEDISKFERIFRFFLDSRKEKMPNISKIHIFYSGPTSLAFSLGRMIKDNIDSEFIVYNFDQKSDIKYSWALSFNNKENKCIYKKMESHNADEVL